MSIWEIHSYMKSPSEISFYLKESLMGVLCPMNGLEAWKLGIHFRGVAVSFCTS